MNKKKLFLHIGTHKTGSTALQVFLTENRENLYKNGVLYPDIGCPEFSRYGQHQLAWLFFNNENYLPVFEGNIVKKDILENLNIIDKLNSLSLDETVHTIVLSSEEFSVLKLDEIQSLARNLNNFNVEVIVYFRRQDYYLEASYGTSVLFNGYSNNFSQFMNNQRMNLNYYEVVKNWEASFGSRVHVRSYEDKLVKKDIISDFSKIIDIKQNEQYILKSSRVNKSISADALEVIRGLRLRSLSESDLKLIRRKFDKIYSSFQKKELGTFINEEKYMKLKELYSSNNQKLYEEYTCNLIYEEEYTAKNVVKDFEESLIHVFLDIIKDNKQEIS